MAHYKNNNDTFFRHIRYFSCVEFYCNLDMTTAIFNAILEVSFFSLFVYIQKAH